ncbi:MAG: S8 family serine peptidase [bacterium]
MNRFLARFSFCLYLIFFVAILFFPKPAYLADFELQTAQKKYPANDMFYEEQWYLDKINISGVWKYTTGSSKIVVAVIDSGVDINHPDIKNNIWLNSDEKIDGIDNDRNGYIDDINGWDFIQNSSDPRPKIFGNRFSEEGINHGTIVAGVIAAEGNNSIGISGISWHSKIMPLRVLDEQGNGDVTDVVEAIDYAINNGADIINLSFVGCKNDPRLKEAINRAYLKDVVVITSAGNEGFSNLDSQFLAYEKIYNGGVKVAVGNVDDDKQSEIITGPTKDSPPLVNIFDSQGNLKDNFFAFAENFRGGVNVAAGDINGDGIDEIIAGAGFTGGPHVRIFDSHGNLQGQFFAFAENFRGGVNVAAGEIITEGAAEIISGAGQNSPPYVRIKSLYKNKIGINLNKFPLYPTCYKANNLISVASIDVDGRKSLFSNYGNNCVNFAAPGEFFFGLKSNLIYDETEYYGGYWSGTSLATPVISGVVALMKSVKNDLKPEEIIKILAKNSEKLKLKDGEVLYGSIDSAGAIKQVKEYK